MRVQLVFVLALSSLACATPPDRIAQTASGKPEVTIHGATLDDVSAALINAMLDTGFILEEQSQNSLLFARELEGGQAIAAQLLIGNSYSTTPKSEVRFTLASTGEAIRIIGHTSMSTQMAFGQVNREDMSGNNYWFNDIQRLLQRVEAATAGSS